jgi:uncharacterized protein
VQSRTAGKVNSLDNTGANLYIVDLKIGKLPMIIKIYDIEESLSVKGRFDGSKFRRPEDEEISFRSPIEFELTIVKSGDTIWLRGPVKAEVALKCSRCLGDFSYSIRTDLDIEFAPKSTAPAAPEIELKSDELDLYYYEGEDIEIESYVFEEVMLSLPIKALCSDSCKGICPTCGTNMNIEQCRCKKVGTTVLGEKLATYLKEH